jgi:hypothetical protein
VCLYMCMYVCVYVYSMDDVFAPKFCLESAGQCCCAKQRRPGYVCMYACMYVCMCMQRIMFLLCKAALTQNNPQSNLQSFQNPNFFVSLGRNSAYIHACIHNTQINKQPTEQHVNGPPAAFPEPEFLRLFGS